MPLSRRRGAHPEASAGIEADNAGDLVAVALRGSRESLAAVVSLGRRQAVHSERAGIEAGKADGLVAGALLCRRPQCRGFAWMNDAGRPLREPAISFGAAINWLLMFPQEQRLRLVRLSAKRRREWRGQTAPLREFQISRVVNSELMLSGDSDHRLPSGRRVSSLYANR